MTIKRKITGALGLIKINIVNWAICNMTPLVPISDTVELRWQVEAMKQGTITPVIDGKPVTWKPEATSRAEARRQRRLRMRKGKSTMVNRIADWIVAQ